eukprot:gene16289-18454_t
MSLILNEKSNVIAYILDKDDKKVGTLSYEDKSSSVKVPISDIELKENHKFVLAPRPLNEKERVTLFVAGESGAGKSHFIREYAKRYKKMFPKNEMYLISYLEKDETLDEYKKITRLDAFNKSFLEECLDWNLEEEFSNTFVIFDDIDSIVDKKTKQVVYGLLNKMLRIGRHYGISVAYVGHELYASHELKNILNESMTITFFPRYLNNKKLKYLLENYFGLSKFQIDK